MGEYVWLKSNTEGLADNEKDICMIPSAFYYVTDISYINDLIYLEIIYDDKNAYIPVDSSYSVEKAIGEHHKITDGYMDDIAESDDAYDYRWKYDYQSEAEELYVRDSINYNKIFHFEKPSIEDIKEVLTTNDLINQEDKELICEFAEKWLRLWPESDLSVLKYNLKNMKIERVSQQELTNIIHSMTTIAAFDSSEDTIYVLEDSDYAEKGSSDYTIFIHELIHASRTAYISGSKGTKVCFCLEDFGIYTEEALTTRFASLVQGGERKSVHSYTIQTTFLNIICDAIGYNGEDYMNHSVNYLIDKMDNYTNDDQYAYHIISLIDMHSMLHYPERGKVPTYSDNFKELCRYITEVYCRSYYGENVDGYDVEKEFNIFWDIRMFDQDGIERRDRKMTNRDSFKPFFEAYFEREQ